MFEYNKDEIKESLTIEQIYELLESLGGEPRYSNSIIVSRTICHNPPGEGSHKLYYYDNTHLFKCYTGCGGDAFDVFELICKIKNQLHPNVEWQLTDGVNYVAYFFGISGTYYEDNTYSPDWDIFKRYENLEIEKEKQIIELVPRDDHYFLNYPTVLIPSWEKEGISEKVLHDFNIRFNPCNSAILIPHYDKNGKLIGVRERTMVKDLEIYGKYKPAIINREMYNHPLSFNLYGLHLAKDNIKQLKKAIVVESEKGVMQYASYFGTENLICVACCGSSLIDYQVQLLEELGVEEIIVAFDKDFEQHEGDEFDRVVKKLTSIHNKYHNRVLISFMFDKYDDLGYKDSPLDQGRDVFIKLFDERIFL